ncbi:MAG: cytochrome ubiquinol oxidase subunit I [Vicinamibacteria bacterium]|jgi:cytochrome d ubiquinol oxidase subunit I|nr:cytochrome ubiquinol oxidase subunit I [Vicinamibacteria bacterium]
MDAVLLSRLQFALTIMFHYIFPPLSIGLGLILVVMEGLYLKNGDKMYLQMARFWGRVFGLIFAMGVLSGIVMEFQFGTNWAAYSRFVGDVFGSALAAEGILAFFMESLFLAVLLFGWDKVGPRLHFVSTILVCLGAHLSAVWIIVADSWMQTPAGFRVVETELGRRAEMTDFWAMVFNPSSIERLAHTLIGAWQAGAFLVVSVSAWYLLKKRHQEFAERSLRISLIVALIASLSSLVTGDIAVRYVAKHQKIKLAAFEGHYPANRPAPLHIVGWVDERNERVIGIALPGMLSLLLHYDTQAPVTGLQSVPKGDRPPVNIVFQAFHAMVGIGSALIALTLLAAFYLWRGRLFTTRWLLGSLVAAFIGPQLANQLGWLTAEVGRQPWIVQDLMRTSEAVSPSVKAGEVLTSLLLFGAIYALLLTLFIVLMLRKIQHGPQDDDATASQHQQ